MRNFRTEIPEQKAAFNINHKQRLFFMGSCFSTHIYNQVKALQFKVLSNPYGVLFNPLSIATALQEITANKTYSVKDLIQHNDLYHSFQHHSSFSSLHAEESLANINLSIQKARQFLAQADYVFITLGSAWVYKYTDGTWVANCHKIPNKQFTKTLLTVEAIEQNLKKAIAALRSLNPKVKFVFTVSPVRHLKDGFEENTVSKSMLRAAIYQIQQSDGISYFPSYEIMLDDLRDYRFYKEDMLHPNEVAVQYIFDHFAASYFSESTQALNARIKKLNLAKQHRFFNENTASAAKHRAFIAKEQQAVNEALEKH